MKDILTSPRVKDMKRKRRVRQVRLSILLIILIISVVSALAYFSSNSHVKITNIVVTGTRIINPPEVEELIKRDLEGKYLRLFARSNGLIYPKRRIYNDLLKSFPRIETLSVYRDNLTTLHIQISERAGASLYCGNSVPENQSEVGENCYFVNNDGYVFDKAPYFSGNVYFKYYIPLQENNPLGKQILSVDRFHQIARFVDSIIELGFKPIYLVIASNGDDSLYLKSDLNQSTKIMFKDENDLQTILDNLTLSMSKPEFANEIKSKYTSLQYIDLRFKNKVLYKFQ